MSRYQNESIRYGLQGLVLKPARDVVSPDQAVRLINLYHSRGGRLLSRRGQTLIGTAGGFNLVSSIRRLNAQAGAIPFTRFYGVDFSLLTGTTGNPSVVASGYSGQPLVLVPYRSEIAGDAWMYVADSAVMNKVRIDGVVMPIGLPAPPIAPTAVLGSKLSTTIDPMNSTSGWNGYHDSTSGTPTIDNSAVPPAGGNATTLKTNAGSSTKPYANWMDKALTVDLTKVGGQPASGSDYIHIQIYVGFPALINEVRIYFTTSTFTSGVLPGTSLTQNVSGYWTSFLPDAFAQAVAGAPISGSNLSAAQQAATHAARMTPSADTVVGTAVPRSSATNVGAGAWTEFGVVGRTLYRSDFTPFGNTVPITETAPNGSWGTVTGVVVWISIIGGGGVVYSNVAMAVNDCYLFGGYGLDDGPAGTIPYDYVSTNYDPRTGAESNLSGTVASPAFSTDLDALRSAIVLTPAPYGNAAVRQRFYRRGGTLTDNWYFTGQNTGDGAAFTDGNTDAFVQGTGLTAPVDHFQPVPTVDTSGNTVLGYPVRALWGPVQGMLFACGDPYRPGWLYASKPNEPDHWAVAVEVCGPTEQLVMGCVWGDRAFVFSHDRGYQIIPNLDAGGGLTTLPTSCQHGVVCPGGLAVGLGGVYLVSRNGIFRTTGADEGIPISDDIFPIFDGQQWLANPDAPTSGVPPIDFEGFALQSIRLKVIGTDLWFLYRGTSGAQICLIYSLIYEVWRQYVFTNPIAEVAQEEGVDPASILLGEAAGGTIDQYSGLTDRGAPIVWEVRSGALDQGSPRSEKRYGNWAFDINNGGGSITAQAFINEEAASYPPVTIVALTGRQRYTIDPFQLPIGQQVRARNLSCDLSGSTPSQQAILYLADLAYELEPADYVRWETDELDHGIPGWHTPLSLSLAVRGSGTLTLTRTVFDDRLNILLIDSYSITATSVKSHQYVTFQAMKGALFQYQVAGANAFRIYEDESSMLVQPFNGGNPVVVRPFSTQELSGVQKIVSPLLAAMRPGGAG